MKKLLGIILLAGVSACSWEPETLHLSPGLPEHVQVSFMEAAAEWNSAQDVHVLKVTQEPDLNGNHNVFMDDLPDDKVGRTKKTGIVIDPAITEGVVWHVVAHELGHWFGAMEHTTGGIMKPRFDNKPYLKCIDAESAAFLGGKGTCNGN